MVIDSLSLNMEGSLGFCKPNELDGDHSALVEELEERMLAIGTGLTEIYHSCLIF